MMFDTLHQFEIETDLPDAESLRRVQTRLQLDPQDRWTRLYSVGDSQPSRNGYRFTIVDRFLGRIGVKVTGSVEGGMVRGRFALLLPERLFFLLIFGLCLLVGASFLSKGQTTAFLDVLIAFFFAAFVYIYRALRFRDLISSSVARTLNGKKVGDPQDRPEQ